jgi:dihydropteroate synthase
MPVTEDNSDRTKPFGITLKNRFLDLHQPVVMGILNVTPDSFYDGGKHGSEKEMINHTEKMIKEGATIIDIGAISTRPGSKEISEKAEELRLKPVLKSLIYHFPETIFSVDTYRSRIVKMAVQEGVQIVNDISGGSFDTQMPHTIAQLKVPFVMMHIFGTPQIMQLDPHYNDVVSEVKKFFEFQLQKFKQMGVTENIILDPGFGFGKTLNHNYQLLKDLNVFRDMGFPVMAGLSRKSMIYKLLKINPKEALNGTTVLNVIALLNGANILRVHDVKEAIQAIELVRFYHQNIK